MVSYEPADLSFPLLQLTRTVAQMETCDLFTNWTWNTGCLRVWRHSQVCPQIKHGLQIDGTEVLFSFFNLKQTSQEISHTNLDFQLLLKTWKTTWQARGWDHHIARCPPPVGVEALSPSDTLLPAWGCSRINCLYLQACASSHSKEKSKVLPVPMALPSVGKMTDQESYRLKKNKSRGNSLWTLFLCIQNRKDTVEGHCFFAKLTLHIICLHNLSGTFSIWI